MEICRSCLSSNENMVPLVERFISNYNLLTNLNITLLDGMPQYSCQNCIETVNFFIEFRDKCISSENTLQDIIYKKIKSEEKVIVDIDTKKTDILVNNNIDIKKELKVEKQDQLSILENSFPDNFDDFDGDIQYLIKYENIEDEEVKPRRSQRTKKTREKLKLQNSIENLQQQLPCGICSKILEDRDSLYKHLESHKNDRNCRICHETFNNWPQLLAHRITHIPVKQRTCHICSKKFVNFYSLEYHYLNFHYDGQVTKLTCKQCMQTYENPKKLRKHLWFAHSDKTYICDICSKVYNNKQRLASHMLCHREDKTYVCDLCGFSCRYSGGLKDHKVRKHTLKKCYCTNCKRAFPDQKTLDKHKCKHTNKVCPVCGKQLFGTNKFTRHMETHREVGRHKCDRCPATYKSRGALVVHQNRHDGIRTKQCEFCQAKFYSASVLIKHRRTHTGEKPYVCKVCQKGFTGNHNLKVHMKVHGEMLIVKKVKEPEVSTKHIE